MKGEKTFFKENIPAVSVQRKSRSISVLQKNLVTIIQNTPFVKAEVDSVEYFVLCLKRYVRLL
jgi:hypothetical protein